MCQHAYCFIAICQRFVMGTNIHAIGQATNDKHLRTQLVQFSDELMAQVSAVVGYLAGAYYADNPGLIQVGITFII